MDRLNAYPEETITITAAITTNPFYITFPAVAKYKPTNDKFGLREVCFETFTLARQLKPNAQNSSGSYTMNLDMEDIMGIDNAYKICTLDTGNVDNFDEKGNITNTLAIMYPQYQSTINWNLTGTAAGDQTQLFKQVYNLEKPVSFMVTSECSGFGLAVRDLFGNNVTLAPAQTFSNPTLGTSVDLFQEFFYVKVTIT